ncbi:unnamed protein product [Durusdinium trenchii]|uniref:EF-hand domain-containing protein n=1 Tax=Durusdinium trenchii TaxID=1381693 RepID=A0ABP0N6T6_9DINO
MPYQKFPWKLCQLADPRVSLPDRKKVAEEFVSAELDTLDLRFSRRLRALIADPADILPGGKRFAAIDGLTMTKCQNVQIEDNFARAVCMRKAGNGKSYLQSSGVSKHILAELKAAHRQSFGLKTAVRKSCLKQSRKPQKLRLIPQHDFKQLGLDLKKPEALNLFSEESAAVSSSSSSSLQFAVLNGPAAVPLTGSSSSSLLQRMGDLEQQVMSTISGCPLQPVATLSSTLADDCQEEKKRVKLFNGWTLYRSQVLEQSHQLPGESARDRDNEQLRESMRLKAVEMNKKREGSMYQRSASSSNLNSDQADEGSHRGLLATTGDNDYPLGVSLITAVHSIKNFVKRADDIWRANFSSVIGKVSLPRLPSDSKPVSHEAGAIETLVSGLLSNLVRLMKQQAKTAGPAITSQSCHTVLLVQPDDGGKQLAWIIVRATFRPFYFWCMRLELRETLDNVGMGASLQMVNATDKVCLPLIDSMDSIKRMIVREVAAEEVDMLSYMLPTYDLDWMQPLQNILLRTDESSWTGWNQEDAAGALLNPDNSDGDSEASGGEEPEENKGEAQLQQSAKRLPYSAEVKMGEWLLAGKLRFAEKDAGPAHKQMFNVGSGACFNEAFYVRLLTFLCLDDLRWQRWRQMNSTTYQMAKANISKYDDFYCDQVVQVLQRLLRSIPDAKVSLDLESNEMKPLYTFVAEMVETLPVEPLKLDFGALKSLLESPKVLPDAVTQAAAAFDHSDGHHNVFKTFLSVKQGPTILELAVQKAKDRAGTMKHLTDLSDLREELCKLEKAQAKDDWFGTEAVVQIKNCVEKCENLSNDIDSGDPQFEFVGSNTKQILELLQRSLSAHVDTELSPWIKSAAENVSACSLLPQVPDFAIMSLRKVPSSFQKSPVVIHVHSLAMWYDSLTKLSETSSRVKDRSIDAGAACTELGQIKKEASRLKVERVFNPLAKALQSVWEAFYQATIKDALHEASKVIAPSIVENAKSDNGWCILPVSTADGTSCLRKCTEASWVATGLDCDSTRIKMVVDVLYSCVNAIQCRTNNENTGCACHLWKLAKHLKCIDDPASAIRTGITIDSDKIRSSAEEVFQAAFDCDDSGGVTKDILVRLEQVGSLTRAEFAKAYKEDKMPKQKSDYGNPPSAKRQRASTPSSPTLEAMFGMADAAKISGAGAKSVPLPVAKDY